MLPLAALLREGPTTQNQPKVAIFNGWIHLFVEDCRIMTLSCEDLIHNCNCVCQTGEEEGDASTLRSRDTRYTRDTLSGGAVNAHCATMKAMLINVVVDISLLSLVLITLQNRANIGDSGMLSTSATPRFAGNSLPPYDKGPSPIRLISFTRDCQPGLLSLQSTTSLT